MSSSSSDDDQIGELITREERADQLPFFLRAWWMRDYLESDGLQWTADSGVTSPLWSLHSDPLCDVGSVDQSY